MASTPITPISSTDTIDVPIKMLGRVSRLTSAMRINPRLRKATSNGKARATTVRIHGARTVRSLMNSLRIVFIGLLPVAASYLAVVQLAAETGRTTDRG